MTLLYDKDKLLPYKSRYKRQVFAVIAVFVATVIFNIVFFILLNDENALAFRITITALDILAFWFIFAFCSLRLVPTSREIRFIDKMITSEKLLVSGKIQSYGKNITLAGGSFIEIIISDGNTERVIYFEKSVAVMLRAGDTLSAFVVDGVIFSFEVQNGR